MDLGIPFSSAVTSACKPLRSILTFPTHHFELGERHFVHQPWRKVEIFAHRELHVLAHGERGEQRALLEQNAPTAFERAPLGLVGFLKIDGQHLDQAMTLRQEPDDGAQEN